MKRLMLAATIVLGSCNQSPQPNASAQQGGATATNPVGRYQMQAGVNPASVVVLDTRYGTLQNCTLVDERYHCLSQDRSAETEGGMPDPPTSAN